MFSYLYYALTSPYDCQETSIWITDLCLITGQFWDHCQGHLHGYLVDHLWLTSDSISDPITSQLCDHRHDFPHDCLYDCLIDHLCLITSKLHDQLSDWLHIPNSDIAEAQDPHLGVWEAMEKCRHDLNLGGVAPIKDQWKDWGLS